MVPGRLINTTSQHASPSAAVQFWGEVLVRAGGGASSKIEEADRDIIGPRRSRITLLTSYLGYLLLLGFCRLPRRT
jgi:hypothetical protein